MDQGIVLQIKDSFSDYFSFVKRTLLYLIIQIVNYL